MQIHILGPGDEGVLETVADEVFDRPVRRASAAEFLSDPRHHIAVAMESGVVVGFVSAVHYVHPDKDRPEMWVNEVGVAPDYRRRGLGRQLLEAVLEVGRELGCTEAWVLTDSTNAPATALYAGTGPAKALEGQVMWTFPLAPDDPQPCSD